ncbi:MAG: nuclear transport factor 2 family protein [Acidimicrobiia bacterium]
MRTGRNLLVTATLLAAGLFGVGFAAVASGENQPDTTGRRGQPVGAQFIQALVDHDFSGAQAMLGPDVEFKGHTPSQGFIDLTGPEAVMSLMKEWYTPAEATEMLETYQVIERHHVGYRIRWRSPEDGAMVFEQHAFYDVDGRNRITRLHLVCSGDQPVAG